MRMAVVMSNERTIKTVQRLINKFGGIAVLRRGATVLDSLKVYQYPNSQHDRDATAMSQFDCRFYIPITETALRKGDLIEYGTLIYRLMNVHTIQREGATVLYVCEAAL